MVILDYVGHFPEAARSVYRGDGENGRPICVLDWAVSITTCNFLRSWAEKLPNQFVMPPNMMLSAMQL